MLPEVPVGREMKAEEGGQRTEEEPKRKGEGGEREGWAGDEERQDKKFGVRRLFPQR